MSIETFPRPRDYPRKSLGLSLVPCAQPSIFGVLSVRGDWLCRTRPTRSGNFPRDTNSNVVAIIVIIVHVIINRIPMVMGYPRCGHGGSFDRFILSRTTRNSRRRNDFCPFAGACSRPRPTDRPTSSSGSTRSACSRQSASRDSPGLSCRSDRRRHPRCRETKFENLLIIFFNRTPIALYCRTSIIRTNRGRDHVGLTVIRIIELLNN